MTGLLTGVAYAGITFAIAMILIGVVWGPIPRDAETWGYLFKGVGLLGLLLVLCVAVLRGALT